MTPQPAPRRRIITSADGQIAPLTPRQPTSNTSSPSLESSPPWLREQAKPAPVDNTLVVQGLADRIAENEGVLKRKLAAVLGQVTAISAGVDVLAEDAVARAKTAALLENETAQRNYEAANESLEQARLHREWQLRSNITRDLEGFAAGAAGESWSTGQWPLEAYDAGLQECQRLGTVSTAGEGVPFVYPLHVGSGWVVSGATEPSSTVVMGTVARIAAQAPTKNLRINVFDPRSSGRMARLAGLRAINGATFPQPIAAASAFANEVNEALTQAPSNAESAAVVGAGDLADLWRRSNGADGTLSVFVLLDYPYGVSPELNQALAQLAQLGPTSGTLLLVQRDKQITPADRVDPGLLLGLLPQVEVEQDSLSVPEAKNLVISPEPSPSQQQVEALLGILRAKAESNTGRTVPLETLVEDDLRTPWRHSSKDALEMVLGVSGRDRLNIALRTQNPAHSNALLGGMVGTGKSNALKDLIYSAALKYSPEELDLVLLDFKAGIEFACFDADSSGEGWLPHVSVLGLESDQQYGVAVLRFIEEELDRRARLFRDAGGSTSLVTYREKTGLPLPRILIVIDEFHVILEGDEDLAQDAADLLELVAKQGRAYGVHLLLASQALSGIGGLRTKAEAIFSQFPIRISLKNSVSESQSFLSQGNRAAADLTYRGEVIVNRNLGQQPELDNIRGLAAYVDQSRFSALQRELWARDHQRRPQVFVGSSFAPWRTELLSQLPRGGTGGFQIWLGRPVSVDSRPVTLRMRSDVDQLVALVGADQGKHRVVPNVLSSILVSSSAQLPVGSEIVILDGSDDETVELLRPALEHARALGCIVTVVPKAEITHYINAEIEPRIDAASNTDRLVLGLGLQRVPGLDDIVASSDSDTGGFSFGAPAGKSARDVLADLARTGALSHTYFIGWWSSVAALEQTVGLSHNGVGSYVTVGCGLDDIKRIAGPLTKRITGSPRIGVFDRESDKPLQACVPLELFDNQEVGG